MNFLSGAARWSGAFIVAALVGYTLASVGITLHNLARLGALGIDIGFANAWNTILFDFKALSPTFSTVTKFGSVVWLGFFIAFPVAHALNTLLARWWRSAHRDRILFALAGATAMAVGIAIIDAQYKVTLVSGTGGVSGYLTQLLAGASGGLTFALLFRAANCTVRS
jgi:hypothetical protein